MINKIVIFVLLALFVSCKSGNDKKDVVKQKDEVYRRVLKDHKWCYLNEKGDTIIQAGKYDFLNPIDEKNMILAHKGNKQGYIDIHENILIPFEYDDIGVFSEGLAPVKKNGKSGFIDRKGKIVIDFIYDGVGYFYSCGLSKVWKGEKVGFINKKGEVVIPIKYDNIDYNKVDNFVIVGIKQEKKSNTSEPFGNSDRYKWAFYSNEGVQLTDFAYDKVYESELKDRYYTMLGNGLILVKKNNKFAYLDKDFKIKIPFGKYKKANPFNKNRLAIVKKNRYYGVIDEFGNEIIPVKYHSIEHPSMYSSDFKSDVFIVKRNAKYGLFDVKGNQKLDITNKSINWDYSRNDDITKYFFLIKSRNNKFGTVNNQGDTIIPFDYNKINQFEGKSVTIVKKNGKYGIINSNNEIIVPTELTSIYSSKWFKHFIITKKGKQGIIDQNGKQIIPSIYQNISPCHYDTNNKFIVELNDKYGVIDKEQNVIIDIKYDDISNWVEYGPKAHFVTLNNKKGLISREGEILIKLIYDKFELLGKHTKVYQNGKCGLLDTSNELILPIEYDEIYLDWFETVYEGKDVNEFYAKKEGKYYLIDKKGEILKNNIPYKDIKKIVKNYESLHTTLYNRQ